MLSGVACRAQRNQVFVSVFPRMAAEFRVMHLKIRHRATGLTPPAVSTQDLLAQTFVRHRIQHQAGGFWANHSQDAFSRRFSRKACCCSPGPHYNSDLWREVLLTSVRLELYSLISRNGEFMNDGIVVTALDARANFGKLLRRVEDEGRSLVIEKRGSPRAVLLSIRDYVRLAVPEPEVLRIIGRESKQKGTNRLGAKQIDQIVRAARKSKNR